MAKRTTRQLLIDMCNSNESAADQIVSRLEALLGTYNEDYPEQAIRVSEVLQASLLFQNMIRDLTKYVKGA